MLNNNNSETGWVGWVYFASIIMAVAGVFQAIAGLTALLRDNYYLVTEKTLVTFDFTTWGWIHLILGAVLISAASSVAHGGMWGRVVGIIVASLSAIANFVFLPAYPIWAVMTIIVDILIIYAIAVHGKEAR